MKINTLSFHKFKIAIIGGTFNCFHQGHKEYIKTAFDLADEILIFITSDQIASSLKKEKYGTGEIKPYNFRKKTVEKYISTFIKKQLKELILKNILKLRGKERFQIKKLNNNDELEDFCFQNEISLAIVAPEYYDFFNELNIKRKANKKDWFYILVKERLTDENGNDISSSSELRKKIGIRSFHV